VSQFWTELDGILMGEGIPFGMAMYMWPDLFQADLFVDAPEGTLRIASYLKEWLTSQNTMAI